MPRPDAIVSVNADDYLAEHQATIENVLSDAVTRVLRERPPDPVAAVGRLLLEQADAQTDALPPNEAVAATDIDAPYYEWDALIQSVRDGA